MTEPAPPVQPADAQPQFIQLPMQGAGLYTNHIFAGSDGSSVFLTFYQASPSPPAATPQQPGTEPRMMQTVLPMIATPVAKVVLPISILPQIIATLQNIVQAIQPKSP